MKKIKKSAKPKYYLKRGIELLVPNSYYQNQRESILNSINDNELDQLSKRADYYYKGNESFDVSNNSLTMSDLTIKKNSAYYLDTEEIIRYFPSNFKFYREYGDVTTIPNIPTIVKSRPISDKNDNSVVLKLDKIRHFSVMDKDKIPFSKKRNSLVWRGYTLPNHHSNREELVHAYYQDPIFDIGQSNENILIPEAQKSYLSIKDQLEHKFILSVEGNDVATNLKWIMASNSLCIMRKPRFETWYMEGYLKPNYHYALVNDDFSNLHEVVEYYTQNEKEALEIIYNANVWFSQFLNKKTERAVALMVMEKYFKNSNQL